MVAEHHLRDDGKDDDVSDGDEFEAPSTEEQREAMAAAEDAVMEARQDTASRTVCGLMLFLRLLRPNSVKRWNGASSAMPLKLSIVLKEMEMLQLEHSFLPSARHLAHGLPIAHLGLRDRTSLRLN